MTTEAVQVKKIRLSDARAQLLLTQRALARLADVSPTVISNAELGYAIRRLSAHAILNALNAERNKKGWKTLDIEEIEWKVSGDGEDSNGKK
jgi:predicted transcriptional regulator